MGSIIKSRFLAFVDVVLKRHEDIRSSANDLIYRFRYRYRYSLVILKIFKKRLQGKKINIIFLLMHASVWPYDGVYKRFKADTRFNTNIVIVPYTLYGKDEMLRTLNDAKKHFCNEKYNAFSAYDEMTEEFREIKSKFDPDIVFFTNPHDITEAKYYIHHFTMDTLTCYVPYAFMSANINQMQHNLPFHSLLWRIFCETKIHKKIASRYAENKAENVIVTGYPKCDAFFDRERKSKEVWKWCREGMKRIIWAPHHTIENNNTELGYSTFLKYHNSMLDLVQKYRNTVQFALKPHPLLWLKLRTQAKWTDKQINEYRNHWINEPNSQLEEAEYIDLFIGSDGIVLDSISFISEYMYLNKPSLFLIKDESVENKFNDFGVQAFVHLYKAKELRDIREFIEKTVIKKIDTKSVEREKFINQHLLPRVDGTPPSEIIYRHVMRAILMSIKSPSKAI